MSQNPASVVPPHPLFRRLPGNAFAAHTAAITGEVEWGELCSFWFSAVVRGDVALIRFGRRCNVQDCAVVHCDTSVPNLIGDDVVIGHNATVHGAEVGSGTLIGMGATVLGRSKIGRNCLIAAGAVVAPGMVVPDGKLVMGVPGKVVRDVGAEDLKYMQWLPPHYAELAERYARGEIRGH
jgi:carbonic anhydrase/acetyltransferase-like protein (isoleucine patch superfamily)